MTLTKQEGEVKRLGHLQRMTEAILPPNVVGVCGSTNGNPNKLFREEFRSVERAVPARQAEFAAGRSVARDALQILGLHPVPVPVGPLRAPIWPNGVTGSISHCRSAAVAIAAKLNQHPAHVGVDVEENEPLDRALWDTVCTSSEQTWLRDQADPELWAKIIFSIKEAAYKAQFPLTGRMLDFQDVELGTLSAKGRFVATISTQDLLEVGGRFIINDDFILTFATAVSSAR